MLWAWIDATYGQLQQTALQHLNLGNQWNNIKITDVGIDRDSQNERLRSMQRRRVSINFRKKSGTRNANSVEVEELEPVVAYLNEDGSIVSESGEILRHAGEHTDQQLGEISRAIPETAESNAATTVESNAVVTSPTSAASTGEICQVASAGKEVLSVDSAIEADFASTIMSSFSADTESAAAADAFEFTVPARPLARSAMRFGMLSLAALTVPNCCCCMSCYYSHQSAPLRLESCSCSSRSFQP